MDRTCRFAVIALGAVTLSNVVNVARLSGQTAPAVIWNFDSLSPGQPPAGFAFARTGGGPGGPLVLQIPLKRARPAQRPGPGGQDRPGLPGPPPGGPAPALT